MLLETKRFLYNKYFIFVVGVFFILIGLSFVNKYIVQGYYNNDNVFALDYYNVVCQTSPFLLTPILGIFFAKDYEYNIYRFYANYNLSEYRYCLIKLFVAISMVGVVELLISTIFLLIMGISLKLTLIVSALLFLDMVYMIILVEIAAYLTRKRMTTIFVTMGLVVILSIVNVIPLGDMTGKIFALDANSYMTTLVSDLINQNGTGKEIVFSIQILYVGILLGIFLLAIKIRRSKWKKA